MFQVLRHRLWLLAFVCGGILLGQCTWWVPSAFADKATEALSVTNMIHPNDPAYHSHFKITRGHYLTALLSVVTVGLCVLLHYEVLKLLSRALSRLQRLHRTRVLVLILGLFVAHVVEIWMYAYAYYAVDGRGGFGHLQGHMDEGWLDYVYFSFVTYATVGYGDILPVGPIRFLAAQEALSGVVLIAWSASFTFLEMQRFWREPGK